MALSLRTNVASLNAQRNLYSTQNSLDQSMARLSSGLRITSAGDDAAGLGISVRLEAQIRSYNQAARNANDGLSLIQTAEAAMNTASSILTRIRELAMQAATDTVGSAERTYLDNERAALIAEIDRNAATAKFNGVSVIAAAGTTLNFQVGIGATSNDTVSVGTVAGTSAGLGVGSLSLTSQTAAQAALGVIDTALDTVSSQRATFGAAGNRLSMALDNIKVFSESLSSANSRIRDVDVAEETSRLARTQILVQAGVSVLAQANVLPQVALKLLG
ncbi:MAG TPA: flagellin [Anaeromyxobacteraceae bacterium]|jgi:flagellin